MLFAAFDALRHRLGQATAAELSWVLNTSAVVYAGLPPAHSLSTGLLCLGVDTRPTSAVLRK